MPVGSSLAIQWHSLVGIPDIDAVSFQERVTQKQQKSLEALQGEILSLSSAPKEATLMGSHVGINRKSGKCMANEFF